MQTLQRTRTYDPVLTEWGSRRRFNVDDPATHPKVGDTVRAYKFSPQNPTNEHLRAIVADPWVILPDVKLIPILCWHDWTITVIELTNSDKPRSRMALLNSLHFPVSFDGVWVPLRNLHLDCRNSPDFDDNF